MREIKINEKGIRPKFVFEYYDLPLVFISERLNGNYYFFYLIDDNIYFRKPLSSQDIKLIFESQNISSILKEFISSDNFEIIEFLTNDAATIYSVSDYVKKSGIDVKDFFPDEDIKFEYEYIKGVSFDRLKVQYEKEFPELFTAKNLTIKLKDSDNSYLAKPSMVLKTIAWVETFIKEKSKFLNANNSFTYENLKLLPFSPGSFNINFELSKTGQISLFESVSEELSFEDIVDFISHIEEYSVQSIYENYLFESPKIVKATNDFYNEMKESEIAVWISKGEDDWVSFNSSSALDEKMKELQSLSKENKSGKESIEILTFEGEVRSASKMRNTISIGINGKKISAQYTDSLFNEIKESKRFVSVSCKITGQWQKISTRDEYGEEISSRYIITDFTQ